jgi:lysylphosphatidylglycerol synthetase-like protein (DUF2156 family)
MMQKIKAAHGSGLQMAWLPLYLLLAVSWLFAPVVHHDHLQHLQLISSYEAFGQPYGWLFRLCDILAATVLGIAAIRYIGKQSAVHLRLVLGIAILTIIDGIFAASGNTSGWHHASTTIHDIESSLSVVAIAAVALYDVVRRKKTSSILFLAFQASCGAVALFNLHSNETLTAIQYIYQIVSITWLAWLVCSFATTTVFRHASEQFWRWLFGIWTGLNGVLLILISALPLQLHHPRLVHSIDHNYAWVAQHGVVVGIVMLYLARHVAQGQKRATTLIGMLLVSQMLVYSVMRPLPILLATTMLTYAALWYGAPAFRKNSQPLKIAGRFADAAVVIAGVALAIGLVFAVVGLSGKQVYLQRSINRAYGIGIVHESRNRIAARDEAIERSAHHLQRVGSTLALVTTMVLLWSLFRPTPLLSDGSHAGEDQRVRQLLERHSRSSEDYFKLWPQDKSYFFNTRRSGFVAYKIAGRTAFALADPVCAPNMRKKMVAAFTEFCHQQGLAVCFLLINDSSKHLYGKPLNLIKIGSSAVIDIVEFESTTVRNKWWRWQGNRGAKAGYIYEQSLPPHSGQLLSETTALSNSWLKRGHHSEQSFVLGYYDVSYLRQCRLHTLRGADGQLVAFANQLPTYNYNSQATVDLIRFKPDAEGAMPMLVMELIKQLHTEGTYKYFDLGFVPLAKVETPIANLARRLAAGRFSAAGLEQFKGKFKPDWHANYIAYDGSPVDLPAILANLNKALKAPR